jgi:ATP-dependent Clp endopeptidase proteolytic subunit ClpP
VVRTESINQAVEDAAKRLQDAGVRHKSAKADDEARGPWYAFKNVAVGDTTAQVDIYDEIDWLWGVTSRDFRDELKALPESVSTIDLHVNSPGGDVYEAIAIMNSLRQHPAKVVTTVDGFAASSAGFIAVGASDELIVAENAEIMAHLPWSVMVGDANEMRKMADDLDRIGKNIASIFVARAGGTLDEWMAILTDETWWSAEEAVEAGIADRVLKSSKPDAKNSARNRFDLSIFNHAGRSAAPAPRSAHTETPRNPEAEKGKEPTVALSEGALQKLGLDADADETQINEAIEKIAEPEAPAEPTIEQAAAVAAKFGQKLVNVANYDQMAATVADLQARNEAAIAAENETAITNALTSGRIDAASADTWRAELGKNREGTLSLLATLPANKAVPVDEIGHGVSREDSAQDAEMATVAARITGKTFGKDA